MALCSFLDSGIKLSKRVLQLAAVGVHGLGIQPMHSLDHESTVQLLSGGHEFVKTHSLLSSPCVHAPNENTREQFANLRQH